MLNVNDRVVIIADSCYKGQKGTIVEKRYNCYMAAYNKGDEILVHMDKNPKNVKTIFYESDIIKI